MAEHGETRIYVLEAELKMDASETVKEWKHWVLTWLRATWATWAENAVKLELKLGNKNGIEN